MSDKKLTYYDLLFAGIGAVFGAGIFTLIGKASKYSCWYTWLAMIIAGIIIYYIADTYADINDEYATNNSEYLSINNAFGNKISWMTILFAMLGGIFICYVVSLAFGGYISNVLSVTPLTGSIICIAICVFLNILGIKAAARFNNVITIGGLIGLMLIIVLGAISYMKNGAPKQTYEKKEECETGITGVMFSAYILLFSYFGFDLLVKLNKQSENPKRDIPRALKGTIVIATVLYTLLAIVSPIYVHPQQLAKSYAPFNDVISAITSNKVAISFVNMAAVVLIFNTCLLTMRGASQQLYNLFHTDSAKIELLEKTMLQSESESILIDTQKIKQESIEKIEQESIEKIERTMVIYIAAITFAIVLLYIVNMGIITASVIANACTVSLLLIVAISAKVNRRNRKN